MLLLSNDDVADVLDMRDTIEALRIAYAELADGMAVYGPRIDYYLPTGRPDDYHQWGCMVGGSSAFGALAIRMKSDIVFWPENKNQEKYCVSPGRYCGLVFLFSTETGAPIGLLQDGYLQHLRVGAAAAIGTDLLARPGATTLGCLGSGGMARSMLEGVATLRSLEHVRVYSPTAAHRRAFGEEMASRIGVEVEVVANAEAAVHDADIVLSATDSLGATFDADWLDPGSHVTCVTRRELDERLLGRARTVVQLGSHSVPVGTALPMMEWKAGGIGSYVAGRPEDRARIPAVRSASTGEYATLLELQSGVASGRTSDDDVTLFIPTGTQGLQFAAVGARALERARRKGLGRNVPDDWLLQDIRD